jgi:hypothetical protein
MAGRKLSAKAGEEVEFMEQLLARCDALARPVEEYSTAKKGADQYSQQIVRALQEMRQHAMMKNLGPIADAAGVLSVQCGRGSQMMRARTMREGIAGFKQLLDRTIKATIEADARQAKEKEVEAERAKAAEKAAAQRMAERALREEQLARQKAAAVQGAPVAPAAPAAVTPPKPEAKP